MKYHLKNEIMHPPRTLTDQLGWPKTKLFERGVFDYIFLTYLYKRLYWTVEHNMDRVLANRI